MHLPAGLSKQVDSQVNSHISQSRRSNGTHGKAIPPQILNKYLKVGPVTLLDTLQQHLMKLSPIYSLTLSQFTTNYKNLLCIYGSHNNGWPFSSHNISIYLAIWLPITLTIFGHIILNKGGVWSIDINVIKLVAVDIGTMGLLSFAGFIYSNMLKYSYNGFIQHLTVCSHVNIITVLYMLLNLLAITQFNQNWPQIVLTVIYLPFVVYIHFNGYNRAIKPSLLQFIALLVVIMTIQVAFTILCFKCISDIKQSYYPQQVLNNDNNSSNSNNGLHMFQTIRIFTHQY